MTSPRRARDAAEATSTRRTACGVANSTATLWQCLIRRRRKLPNGTYPRRGRVHGVGTFHSVIFFVFGSNIAKALPLNLPHHTRSCGSMWPRRHPEPFVGKSYQTVCNVLPSVNQSLSLFICMPYMLFFESATTS